MQNADFLQAFNNFWQFSAAVIRGFFDLLPNVVWSGIVGSIITLVGVRATNKHHSFRADRQLTHDANKFTQQLQHETNAADIARKYDVRQKLYIDLYAQLVKANVMLASYPHLQTDKALDQIQETFSAISKASVLADQKTVLLLGDFQTVFGSLVLFANGKNLVLSQEKSEEQSQSEINKKSQLEIERILSEMTRYNETVEKNPDRFSALQRSYDIQAKISQDAQMKRRAAADRFQDLLQAYGKDYMQKSLELRPLLLDLFSAIRSELILESNISEIRAHSDQNIAALQSSLDDLFELINSRRSKM